MNYTTVLLFLSACLLTGCGRKDESVAKTAGSKVGEAVTDFALGVGKGFDKKMVVKVELSPLLVEKGLSTTVAKWIEPTTAASDKGISVYVIATKALKGRFVAKALTEKGVEIGRSTTDAEFKDDDAKYVQFRFGSDMDTQLVAKYLIDIKAAEATR